MFKKIIRLFIKKKPAEHLEQAHIIPRTKHNVSRAAFSESSLKVLTRLHKAGFSAYLVGGSIRDLVLGKEPKDFDIATNAHPEEIKKLFSNCLLIGKRFRLAHIRFGREIIEVATFRSGESVGSQFQDSHGMILRDNIYGTIEQDVMRRDFTINALYYNIADFSLVDYVNGLDDIHNNVVRIIGDAVTRYKEDPVRMLRAVRFAAKLDFSIADDTAQPIKELAVLLNKISPARLFEEYMKLFLLGAAVKTYSYLLEYDLLKYLFSSVLAPQDDFDNNFIHLALKNTDQRILENKPLSPAFLLSVFMLPWILKQVHSKTNLNEVKESIAWMQAIEEALHIQQASIAIPRKIVISIREILELQYKLDANRSIKKIAWVLEHPKFRAAYDIILLRAQAGDAASEILGAWWTKYLESDEEERLNMSKELKRKSVRKDKGKNRFRKSKPRAVKLVNNEQ